MAFFINGEGDHGGTVGFDELHDALVAGAGAVAVFEVDGVHGAASTQVFKPGLDNIGFGGVDHDRQGGASGQEGREGSHVAAAVAAHVVDAQVEHVGAVAGLLFSDIHAGFQVTGEHGLTEGFGPVGVSALPDDGDAGVLGEVD